MKLFASNDEVASLEAGLGFLAGVARLDLLITLSWHLRQRNPMRSLRLADEAESILDHPDVSPIERERGIARLVLVRAEQRWLRADLDGAARWAESAIATYRRLNDRVGVGDANWLLASICGDRGDAEQRDRHLEEAIDLYGGAGDGERVQISLARSLLYATFKDLSDTTASLARSFLPTAEYDPAVTAWLASARAMAAMAAMPTVDFGQSTRYFLEAHGAAMETGQIRQAIVAATNAADNFSILGDLDTALEWDELALNQARATGWPGTVGNALMQTGNVLRLLGRHHDAHSALIEALDVRGDLKESHGYAITLGYLGDLALDIGDPATALDYFRQAEARDSVLGGPMAVVRSWRGQANALVRLGRPAEARSRLAAALELARAEGSRHEEIDTLRVYAELSRFDEFVVPGNPAHPGSALGFLNQALAVAATIDQYIVPAELYDEVASASAATGDLNAAYTYALAAARSRESKRLDRARNRAIALRVLRDTERAQVRAERQRQSAETDRIHEEAEQNRLLAAAHAEQSASLIEATRTLETLGLIGQEITASLEADSIFQALYRHVDRLLDVTSFDVYLLDPDGVVLRGAFGVEGGLPSPLVDVSIDDVDSYVAECARLRLGNVVDVPIGGTDRNLVPGTQRTRSLLFSPLLVGERLLGVMSIQSERANVYGERERSIIRTLCAYGAIGLDNAAAYASAESARKEAHQALEGLRQAEVQRKRGEAVRASLEAQLRESQKMQAIGTLAGGIAHDFNNILATILGNVELLRDDVSGSADALASLTAISKAGSRARDLVQQILSFSRRQPTERRRIDLAPIIQETGRMLRATFPARLVLDVHCDADVPAVFADATQIEQVVINLATNAMQAIESGPGRIEIRLDTVALDASTVDAHPILRALHAGQLERTVRLIVSDTGSGMDWASLGRVFEPFFTTKPVGKGTGLGLSVVLGIVQAHGGEIVATSQLGLGSTFTAYLPAAPAGSHGGLSMPVDGVPGAPTTTPSSGRGQHVLYLDDDVALVSLVERSLERRGISVSGHDDQQAAIDSLRADPASYDLVVIDYNMPGPSGLDVAREVRAIRPSLPVTIVSGFVDETLVAQSRAAGVVELILKANASEDLCDAIERLTNMVAVRQPWSDGA